ncbi:aspartate aminotransferase family protein [Nitrogeniibacter aestuarii]|uniref:aspartate aminotransferase family protein n=1 Tax=Nitrogeniibacter aestuarii TaxID=2815343 RepID=UPI001E5DBEAE|nr:aspartate aminotransferase family protein [Nitrogeniibacter aestuarii]
MSYSESRFWHPMMHPAAMKGRSPLRIVRGRGCRVFDADGNEFVDGVAGLWNVNAGHDRPEIKTAIVEQMNTLEYYQTFDGVSNPRAEELSARMIGLLDTEDMARVLFSSGGSDATETALKMARQYWKACGQPERTKFISLKEAYHGSHFLSASVNGAAVFRRNYEPLISGCFQVQNPWVYRNPFTHDPEELAQLCAMLLEREIEYQGPDTVAAFIAEPVQGAGGVIVPPASYWPRVREICDRHGVLLIADEVVTGFGRTGSLFGARGWGVKPDIMCFAKGLSSGYVPLGATTFNRRVADALEGSPDFSGAIMHGYTYSGHPVGCAAALAAIDIVVDEDLPGNAARQGDYLMESLQPFVKRFETIGEVRGKGLMMAIDLVRDKTTREPIDPMSGYAYAVAEVARKHGAIVRPVGTKIILSPPLVIQREDIDRIVQALDAGFTQTPFTA